MTATQPIEGASAGQHSAAQRDGHWNKCESCALLDYKQSNDTAFLLR